ncbi:TRAM domain-containing protein [Staphylococcus auricularis]|uniref:TRAM domain-containing protein n=1 Tax=Staphylococcus auricularis TaxID=29379 RepID=UPI003EBF841D
MNEGQRTETTLNVLTNKISYYSSEAMQQYENEVVTVLCEGENKRDDNIFAGDTDQSKSVNFSAPEKMNGKRVNVEIDIQWYKSLNGTFLQEHEAMVTG